MASALINWVASPGKVAVARALMASTSTFFAASTAREAIHPGSSGHRLQVAEHPPDDLRQVGVHTELGRHMDVAAVVGGAFAEPEQPLAEGRRLLGSDRRPPGERACFSPARKYRSGARAESAAMQALTICAGMPRLEQKCKLISIVHFRDRVPKKLKEIKANAV